MSDRLCRAAQDAANRSCRRAGLRGAACSTPENLKQKPIVVDLLLSYLMRAPLFEKITRRVFEAVYYGFITIHSCSCVCALVIDHLIYASALLLFPLLSVGG